MLLDNYLKFLVDHEGSDLYLTADSPPIARLPTTLTAIEPQALSDETLKSIAYGVMNAEQQANFEKTLEMNLAIIQPQIGRFRVNVFLQKGSHSLVIRHIKTQIPTIDTLNLPPILKNLVGEKRGLILFVGATGSGKSTSLAAMVDHRNTHMPGHIITIEDPVEYIHAHKQSIVNQREVGVDTLSYSNALKNTLRQRPDVILIGEIRAQETMEHALTFAETGHLCLSTLHANNANQAIDRIINFFPEERRNQILLDLSLNLRACISQRLVPTTTGKLTAAVEILLGTQFVRDLIVKGDINTIKEVMEKSENIGMQTFDSHLFKLYEEGVISMEDALLNADSPNNLKLKIKLSQNSDGEEPTSQWNKAYSHLSLHAIEKNNGEED